MWTSEQAQKFSAHFTASSRSREDLTAEILKAGSRIEDAKEKLITEVAETSIGHLPGFLPEWLCGELDFILRQSETVTERVETTEGKWTIDLIDNEYLPLEETAVTDPFSVLCLSPEFIRLIGEISAFPEKVITTRRWVNRYGAGDSIAPHDDTTGDFQIMMCLGAPNADFGGTLLFENGISTNLQQGDLLVMRHAELVHWTTALADNTPCERTTATCRYYVEGGRLPRSRVYDHSLAGPKTKTRRISA